MRINKRLTIIITAVVVAIVSIAGISIWKMADSQRTSPATSQAQQDLNKKTGYAKVNGVNMYYETYGHKNNKPPLLLLHGSLTDTNVAFSKVIPGLARDRYVIGLDMQGHGHTADVDGRPLQLQMLADDVAGFLQQQKITKADMFGWSMGGMIATEVALRHPALVHKIAVIGATHKSFQEALGPAGYQGFIETFQPGFAPKIFKEPYDKVSPNPDKWDQLVVKVREMVANNQWPTDEQISGIKTPFLVMIGDRDPTPPKYAAELYSLLPQGQLDILPNADHFAAQLQPQVVLASLLPFLNGPEVMSNEHVNMPDSLSN